MSGMRILIVSDTHRRDGNFRRVLEKTGPIDMLIHLGDTEGSESYFREWVDNDVCVIHVVRGNNDFFSFCDREKEISIGRYRALLTHGHMYGVSLGTEGIKDEAGASVTASHGISSDSATSSSDSRKTLRIRTASFLPRGAFCALTQRGNQYKIALLNMYWDR